MDNLSFLVALQSNRYGETASEIIKIRVSLVWWTLSRILHGRGVYVFSGSHSLVPPRAAGRTGAVCSVRRTK